MLFSRTLHTGITCINVASKAGAGTLLIERALGEPTRGDNFDFVALGYRGTLILGFDGAALALAGVNDLEIVETTNGPWNCHNYEERAEIYVSQQLVSQANEVDNSLFQYVGESCNHGVFLDVHAATGFDYFTMVKIVDITPPHAQLPDRDGYDVDGIVALQAACFEPSQVEESLVFSKFTVFPNPANGEVSVAFSSLQTEQVDIMIFDAQGRFVRNIFSQVAKAGEGYNATLDGHTLAAGTYIVQAWVAGKSVSRRLLITN